MLVSGERVITATGVTAYDGKAKIVFGSAPTVGKYRLILRSTVTVITYTDVFVADGFISTISELQALTTSSKTGYYQLKNDLTNSNSLVINAASRVTFKGVLDGGGYTVQGLNVGNNGMFMNMAGATVKNITFKGLTASSAVFAQTASDTVFENVNLEILGAQNKPFVQTETNVSYQDVIITYGNLTNKTFFIAAGKTQVLLEDDNLTQGDYTVIVGGETQKSTAFASGRLPISLTTLKVGESTTVVCDNGTQAYVYTITRVTALITTFDELIALAVGGEASKVVGNDIGGYYALANDIDGKGALITTDYNWNYSHFIGTLDGNGHTVKNFTAGTGGIFGGIKNATIKNVVFDEVKIYTKSAAAGWNYSGVLACNATNTVFENVTVKIKSYQAVANDNPPSIFHKGIVIGHTTKNVTYKNVTIDISTCASEFTSSVGTIFGTSINGLACENVVVLVSDTSLAARADFFGYTEDKATAIACPNGVTVKKA